MPTADPSVRAERILDAAAHLIAHYGYDKTTVGDIAHEAGVSKGAVYLHWESKDDLFEALLAREMKQLMADLQARVEADPEGGTIPHLYRHALQALVAKPFVKALFVRDARVLGDWARRQGPPRSAQRFLFRQEYVRQMQEAGLLRADLSAKEMAFVFAVLSHGLLAVQAHLSREESLPLEESISVLAEVVRRSLIPESPGDAELGKRALRQYLDEASGQLEARDSEARARSL